VSEAISYRIVVEKIVPVRKGNLAAFATVVIFDKIRIHSIRIIDQPGKSPRVSMPQTEIPAKTQGEKRKFYSIVDILDQNLKEAICGAVLAAYKNQQETQQQGPVRASIPPFGNSSTSNQGDKSAKPQPTHSYTATDEDLRF
jgi:DNA-binding cell septation regulator SpoVG